MGSSTARLPRSNAVAFLVGLTALDPCVSGAEQRLLVGVVGEPSHVARLSLDVLSPARRPLAPLLGREEVARLMGQPYGEVPHVTVCRVVVDSVVGDSLGNQSHDQQVVASGHGLAALVAIPFEIHGASL